VTLEGTLYNLDFLSYQITEEYRRRESNFYTSNSNTRLTRNTDLISSDGDNSRTNGARNVLFFHGLFLLNDIFQAEFTPTRETSKNQDEKTFLTEHPRKVISEGRFHNVPYVVGAVAYESAFFTSKLATIICVSQQL
jgi:hypothetical protein